MRKTKIQFGIAKRMAALSDNCCIHMLLRYFYRVNLQYNDSLFFSDINSRTPPPLLLYMLDFGVLMIHTQIVITVVKFLVSWAQVMSLCRDGTK